MTLIGSVGEKLSQRMNMTYHTLASDFARASIRIKEGNGVCIDPNCTAGHSGNGPKRAQGWTCCDHDQLFDKRTLR